MACSFLKLWTLGLILFSAGIGVAQEKVLSKSEFERAWKQGCEKTSRIGHRLVETDEQFASKGAPPYNTYISRQMYLPPDRVWTIAGRKGGKLSDQYEEIRIGRVSYSRDGDGAWKQKELGFSGLYYCELEAPINIGNSTGAGIGSSDRTLSVKTDNDYKDLGRQKLNGQWTRILVHVKTITFSSSPSSTQFATTHKYWISKLGTFLKAEFDTHSRGTEQWSRQRREYDYGQKDLRIEAPTK